MKKSEEKSVKIKHEAFVYKWVSDYGMIYVGFHIGSPGDGYVSSSESFNSEYNACPSAWTREILAYGTAREMEAFETGWLRAVDARKHGMYLNKWNNDNNYTMAGTAEEHSRDFICGTLTMAGVQPAQGKSKKKYYVLYINDQLISCNPDWVSKTDAARIQRMVGNKVGCTVTWKGNFAYFSPANLNMAEA